MLADLRHALRSLYKTPGFTLLAMLIVSVGIGAATAMFSTVNALVLRPVALPEPDRLAAIYETNLPRNQPFFSVSIPNYFDWKNRTQSWESIAAMNWHSMNLTGEGEPQLVQAKAITANFLPTLGIPIQLGRNFLPEEDKPGGGNVAILSASFWQSHFAGTRDVIGRTLHLDGRPYVIVGVTAPGQPLPEDLDLAIPLAADPAASDRMNHENVIYGRLKRGVTFEQADAELKTIARQIWTEHPELDRGWSTRLVPFAREIVGDETRHSLSVLLGAVGLLLLIACANFSNLLLVRASARAHELAIRTALGATRRQVIRQIVTESVIVALAGGLLGILLSIWTVDLLHSLPLPRAAEISVDFRVLGLALSVTLIAGLFSGLGPALRAAQAQPQDALKRRSPRSGHPSRLRDAMVVAQIAISLSLLVGAALLSRSFLRLMQVNPGFNPENALTVTLRPGDNEHAVQFYEQLNERIAALPGVSAIGLISALPLTDGNTSMNVFPRGNATIPAGQSIQANWRLVNGGYFSTMQIPLIRGRTFAGLTPDEARSSVMLSVSLARLLWGEADPVGQQLDPGGRGYFLTVIGVVGDVRSQKLGIEPLPAYYLSMHNFIYGPMNLIVRLADSQSGESELKPDPVSLLPAIRNAVNKIDPTVPIFRVRTLDQLRATSLEEERLTLILLSVFTGIALLLAALSTYGVIAFTVQQRTQEIGIRRAIGAQTADILSLVLGQGFRLVALGSTIGLAGAFAATRLLSAMLYKTSTTDPWSYLIATGVLASAALGAALLPARRATKVDPMVALRAE